MNRYMRFVQTILECPTKNYHYSTSSSGKSVIFGLSNTEKIFRIKRSIKTMCISSSRNKQEAGVRKIEYCVFEI